MFVFERLPTSGEKSGQPAYAARVAWNMPAFGQDLMIGAGGYYGRQYWGLGRNVDGWVGSADVTFPLGKLFALTGEFYRGRAVGGLNGAIGQDLLISGPSRARQLLFGDGLGGRLGAIEIQAGG